MATRRARIQIKPNTGPRNVGRDPGTDKTPATPPKQPPQAQTKAPNTPAPPTPQPSQPPPQPDVAKSAPQVVVPPPVTKPSVPAVTKAPGPPNFAKTATIPTSVKSSTSTSHTRTATPVSSTETAASSNTTVPSSVEPESPQASPSETDGTCLSLEVFKKPEVPTKSNQITKWKESLPPSVDVSDSANSQLALVTTKKNTKRKSKKGDGEAKRQSSKNVSAFKATEPPDRAKMTIMDLIHWNPIHNPMKRSNETVKTSSTPSSSDLSPEKATSKPTEETSEDYIPGPRVIVGEDGQIMLDETSLVIDQTAPEQDLSQEVVYETSDTTYSSYSKKVISRQFWSMKETAMFYKALSVVGTDFALMAKFFPKRTRADLKRKFKKEERFRRDLLDKAMTEWHKFDLEDIQDFLFCKEAQSAIAQEEEEARVDNPDAPGDVSQPNNYVRENLMNVQPKRRGRPPGNKSKSDNVTEAQTKKNKKTKKRARNLWSDEEAEPVGSGDELVICDDNEEQDICQDHLNEVCDCCQIKTKTSKRQQSLEAKKRKLEELEKQRQKHLQITFAPVREFVPSQSPKQLSDTVSFSVLTNNSVLTPTRIDNTSPTDALVATASKSSMNLTPVANNTTQGTPKANTNMLFVNQTPQTLSKQIVTGRPVSGTPSDLSLPSTSKNVIPTAVNNVNQRTPNAITVISNTPSSFGKVVVANRSALTPKPVNVMNVNKAGAASPLLQALLNRVPLNTPSGVPSQFILVADKTPNNEQVLHVYLVSPNSTQPTTTVTSANGMQVNQDTLQRLGIRPIVQQRPETQRTPDVPETKT